MPYIHQTEDSDIENWDFLGAPHATPLAATVSPQEIAGRIWGLLGDHLMVKNDGRERSKVGISYPF